MSAARLLSRPVTLTRYCLLWASIRANIDTGHSFEEACQLAGSPWGLTESAARRAHAAVERNRPMLVDLGALPG